MFRHKSDLRWRLCEQRGNDLVMRREAIRVGGGQVEKSGGVEGAGRSPSRSSCEGSVGAWSMLGWVQGRFAEIDVKDWEKENT